MAEHSELEDRVSISIGKMLTSLSRKSSNPCISKVPNYLRQENEKAYEPQLISIGPYHRGKAHLYPMEQQKIRFLQKLLNERKENDVSVYVKAMRELKDEARKWYAEDHPIDLESYAFVEMLLLDGVFIVQMIRLHSEPGRQLPLALYVALHQDMLLVENQIPYCVLWKLFCMIESGIDENKFKEAIFAMLRVAVPGKVPVPENHLNSLHLYD